MYHASKNRVFSRCFLCKRLLKVLNLTKLIINEFEWTGVTTLIIKDQFGAIQNFLFEETRMYGFMFKAFCESKVEIGAIFNWIMKIFSWELVNAIHSCDYRFSGPMAIDSWHVEGKGNSKFRCDHQAEFVLQIFERLKIALRNKNVVAFYSDNFKDFLETLLEYFKNCSRKYLKTMCYGCRTRKLPSLNGQ